MRCSLTIIFVVLFMSAQAQDTEREKIRQLELQKEFEKTRAVKMQMDSGVYYMDHENYEKANEKLKYALSNMKSVSSDLVFYFGKNSYFIGKFKQSVDWLSKYIQLKGTTGPFSSEAAEWLKLAEEGLIGERKLETKKAVEVLSRDFTIDCGPSGKVTCPVCSGTTVVIKKNYFGDTYKQCQYCDAHGLLSCVDYNLLIRGQLKPAVPNK